MKISIIRDDLDKETGIGKYVHELTSRLNKRGISVDTIVARKLRVPYGDVLNHIITLSYLVLRKKSEYDILHAITPINGLIFPFVRRKAKVITYHDLTSLLCKESGSRFHVKATARLFLKIGKFCDRIIAVSSQTKDELITYLGFPEEKISVVNLGVDERFKPLNRKKDKDDYIIGYLGDLNKRKRIDYLIRAFKHLKTMYPKLKVKLFIYGKGNDFQKLKGIVGSLKLDDCVEFKGFVPEEKLVEVYNSFDVFVMASEWEGFGLPILEAQRCGVPVVIREDALIPSEVSKCCVKAKSEKDTAEKIYALLTNSALKENIVKKGLGYSKQFTWERTLSETLQVYKEVISEC